MSPADARTEILTNIHSSRDAAQQKPRAEQYSELPRKYHRSGTLDPAARLDLFEQRLREYDAGVYQSTEANLPQKIAEVLASRKKARLVVPLGFPVPWLPSGFEFLVGNDLSAPELDQSDGVVTACTVAIALTGSLILQSAPAQGPRKLSLVPDYHLCIVKAEQVVETVPEALDRIVPTATLPTTFISGPSATADIEMTRIKGVHGPRTLDVLIVL